MKEYKIAKGWAIFIYITTPLLIALFCGILLLPFVPMTKDEINHDTYWFLIPISLGMIAFLTVGLLDTLKGRFVIDNDQVFTDSTFSHKQLLFDEIKGYRITDKHILIESNNENKKGIKVSRYLGRLNEITEWLSANYVNLDLMQANQEREDILNNETFGLTTEERADKLAKAHKAAKVLNWTGILIGAWTLFLAQPYTYVIIASIVFPIICLMVVKYFNGLMVIDDLKGSAYPAIFLAIFAPSIGLFLRGLLDYNIIDYAKIWIPCMLIALSYTAVLVIGNKEFTFAKAKDYLTISMLSLVMFAYGYGAVVTLNCMYDKSAPEKYTATILSKQMSSGNARTYHLELSPWGPQREIDEVAVSEVLYNQLETNDTVSVYHMKGLFNIPWTEVTE